MRDAGLSGIRWVDPVEVVTDERGPTWSGTIRRIQNLELRIAAIGGRGGSIAKANGVKVTRRCEYCGWITWSKRPRSIKIDPEQWDGSDFFCIEEFRERLFTARAAETLASVNLTGFSAEPAGTL